MNSWFSSLLLCSILLMTLAYTPSSHKNYTFPPEWSPHESIWLAWPVYETIKGKPSWPVHVSIMKELSQRKIYTDLLVNSEEEKAFVLSQLSQQKIDPQWVRFHVVAHQDIWMRDMGPIFVVNSLGQKKIVDYQFNDWGYSKISKDTNVDSQIASLLKLETIPSKIFSEGGAWEVNGDGILITTEAVQFQRNPSYSKQDVENEYKRTLGIQKVIWLKDGVPEDQLSFRGQLPGGIYTAITTGGHTDEFVRFVSKDTILLGEVSEKEAETNPILKISRRVLEEAYQILSQEKGMDGKPFRIIRIPMPEPKIVTMKKGDGTFDFLKTLTFEDGSVIRDTDTIRVILASSYLNYLVTNNLVLMPKYYKPDSPKSTLEKDKLAMEILKSVFPDRDIVALDVEVINAGGGGIHCITQQQPK